MSKSKLVKYTKLSPNHSGARKYDVTRITPHCVVGQLTAESLGSWFAKESTQASSNYGIGKDGTIALYVDEDNRSWCSSSPDNDNRAITIECASDKNHPYKMNYDVWDSLVRLCTDICKRYGKTSLLWLGGKDASLNYKPKKTEMVLTVHRWFANTQCPGDWLYYRLDELAKEVTKKLKTKPKTYSVQAGAYKVSKNAQNMKKKLVKMGYPARVVHSNGYYYVRIGSWTKKSDASLVAADLKKSKISCIIV